MDRVPTIDVTMPVGPQNISLRVICMWSIHDPLMAYLYGVKRRARWPTFYAVQIWRQDDHPN
jgi:hypothetical protein